MDSFETLLARHRDAVERFVRFRLPAGEAEDVLQEVYITAYQRFGQVRDRDSFKPWLLAIARSRCADWYRQRARRREVSLDALPETVLTQSRMGPVEAVAVRDAVERLEPPDRQVLVLAYWEQLPQRDIARRLGVPLGTVKSRLHNARERFRAAYPHPETKGDDTMKKTKLPEILPTYTIEPDPRPPFRVCWEELDGWLCVPRPGEKISWGLYEQPGRRRTEWTDMAVVGQAVIHGLLGVEIAAVQHDAEDYYRTGSVNELERRFVAQLADGYVRYLAESHMEDGVRRLFTFLDGPGFLDNWGYGPDNRGRPMDMFPRGILRREGDTVTGEQTPDCPDVVGRYAVTIGGKRYDTVCVMDACCFNDAVVSEDYIDENGRSVLWRRFNRDDWALDHFGGRPWSEQLPDNQRLTVNGRTYVHWYDCITDYIL